MGKNVIYIAFGDYNILSRAKKEINSLMENGYEITLLNGYFSKAPNYHYSFNIIKKKIKQGRNSTINFFHLLVFNLFLYKEVDFKIDIVICRELSVLLAGVIIKQRFNCKLVYDSNELSVETHHGYKKIIWKLIERLLIKRCDLIFHAEANRLNLFKKLHDLTDNSLPMYVLPNYPYFNKIINTNDDLKPNILYFGGIGPQRNIEQLIDAFKELKDYQLDMIGFCSETYLNKLTRNFNKQKITNIKILPQINDADIAKVFKNYTVGIAFYPNTSLNNFYCAPNKVYQYVQNNMAVITTNNPPLVEFVEKYKIGVCIDTVDAKNIKDAINKIIMMSLQKNITLDLKKQYSWEAIESDFIRLIGGI